MGLFSIFRRRHGADAKPIAETSENRRPPACAAGDLPDGLRCAPAVNPGAQKYRV